MGEASDISPSSWPAGIKAVHHLQRQMPPCHRSTQTLVGVFCHYGQQHCDVVWLSSWTEKDSVLLGWCSATGHKLQFPFVSSGTETLTSYIQSIVTGKLCKRRHVVGVIRQYMGLLCDAPGRLLDALIVCILRSKNKAGMTFVFLIPLPPANLFGPQCDLP